MSAGSWMSQQLTYYCGSWQAAQWFIVGVLLLVLLFMYTCTQPFRFMKPLPFISIDWLGLVLWSAFLLELIWLFNYGEHYNWWDSELWLNVLGAVIVTFYFALQRMRHIHHAYLDYRAFKYKTLWPILFMFGVAELMNSTSTSLESVYTGAIMHWGMMTLSIQNIVAIIGSMTGCLFCLWWMKMLRLPYTRLLTIGFGFLLVYQVCMYFYITPTLNFERLIFPTFIRTFGYAIFFTTLTLYLEELMPFQHFFMGLTIAGFVRNGLVSAIGGGLYGFSLRRHIADNLVSGLPFTVFDSMLMAIKQALWRHVSDRLCLHALAHALACAAGTQHPQATALLEHHRQSDEEGIGKRIKIIIVIQPDFQNCPHQQPCQCTYRLKSLPLTMLTIGLLTFYCIALINDNIIIIIR